MHITKPTGIVYSLMYVVLFVTLCAFVVAQAESANYVVHSLSQVVTSPVLDEVFSVPAIDSSPNETVPPPETRDNETMPDSISLPETLPELLPDETSINETPESIWFANGTIELPVPINPRNDTLPNETPSVVDTSPVIISNGTNSSPSSKNETSSFIDSPTIIPRINDTVSNDTNVSITPGNETLNETLNITIPEIVPLNETNSSIVNDSNATSPPISAFSVPPIDTFQEGVGDVYSVERTATGSGGTGVGSTFSAQSYSPSGASSSRDAQSSSFSANVGFYSSTSSSGAAAGGGGEEGGAPPGGSPAPAAPSPGAPAGGGGGGGGGGGPGGQPACTFIWQCNAWTDECTGGTQTRVCTNVGTCKGGQDKPAEVRSCQESLFDIWLNLENLELLKNQNLEFKVTMIETKGPPVDVLFKYSILDPDGTPIYNSSETKAVFRSLSFIKTISDVTFKEGEHLLRVEVSYGNNQHAVAAATFRVTDEGLQVVSMVQYIPPEAQAANTWLPFLILLVLLLLIILYSYHKYVNKRLNDIQKDVAAAKALPVPQQQQWQATITGKIKERPVLQDKQHTRDTPLILLSDIVSSAAGSIKSVASGVSRLLDGITETTGQAAEILDSGVSKVKSAVSTTVSTAVQLPAQIPAQLTKLTKPVTETITNALAGISRVRIPRIGTTTIGTKQPKPIIIPSVFCTVVSGRRAGWASLRESIGKHVFFSSGMYLGKVFELLISGRKIDSTLIQTGGQFAIHGKKGVSVKQKDVLCFGDVVFVNETLEDAFVQLTGKSMPKPILKPVTKSMPVARPVTRSVADSFSAPRPAPSTSIHSTISPRLPTPFVPASVPTVSAQKNESPSSTSSTSSTSLAASGAVSGVVGAAFGGVTDAVSRAVSRALPAPIRASIRESVGRQVFFSSGEYIGKIFELVVSGRKLDAALVALDGDYQITGKKGVMVKQKDILSFGDVVLISENIKSLLLKHHSVESEIGKGEQTSGALSITNFK